MRLLHTQAYQKFNNCTKLDINILFKLVQINRGLISILSRRCECFFSLLIKHMSPKKTEASLWSQTAGTEKTRPLCCITTNLVDGVFSSSAISDAFMWTTALVMGEAFTTFFGHILTHPPVRLLKAASLGNHRMLFFLRWSSFAYVTFLNSIFHDACQLSDGSARWIAIILKLVS